MTAGVISRAEIAQRLAANRALGIGMKRYLRCLERGDEDGCTYCGVELTDTTRTIDHRISVLEGGSNDIENLCLACQKCNSRKGHMSVDEFLKLMGFKQQPRRKPRPQPAPSLGVRGSTAHPVPIKWLLSDESLVALDRIKTPTRYEPMIEGL